MKWRSFEINRSDGLLRSTAWNCGNCQAFWDVDSFDFESVKLSWMYLVNSDKKNFYAFCDNLTERYGSLNENKL